jgi:hypothetical protein
MIVIKLYGGLGNQLFQYSFARFLSNEYDASLLLDISWFKHTTEPRKFELENFKVQYTGFYSDKSFFSRIVRRSFNLKLLKENVFDNSQRDWLPILSAGDNIILDGYWGSYNKYLFEPSFAALIRNELCLKNIPKHPLYHRYLNQIKAAAQPVSIHIRRGDYVNIPLFELCGRDYYERAIGVIVNSIPNVTYFVFSDDIEWVEQSFGFLRNATFVNTGSNILDFDLMQRCNHNIIANSSFSWWAAYLNHYQNKRVILPAKWFSSEKAQAFYETNIFVPLDWTKV